MKFGSYDWRWPQWNGIYYPDDLPEDWRLSYYANEFDTVLLPEDVWQGRREALNDCMAELPSDFTVWLELMNPTISDIPFALSSVAGVLYRGTERVAVNVHENRAVVASSAEPEGMPRCWSPQREIGSDLAPVALVPAEAIASPRQLRTWVEGLAKLAGDRESYLIFEGTPPSLEWMDQAKTIARLLGV